MKLNTFWICLVFVTGFVQMAQAAPRFWVSPAASNWNNTANWSATSGGAPGATVPNSADIVSFDNLGPGNCNIDATVFAAGFAVSAGYTGTITQGANAITINGSSTFSGGIFSGGTANIIFVGAFTLSGTAFTSTSGTLELRDNAAFTGGNFLHNNGAVKFNCVNTLSQAMTGSAPAFYTLGFVGIARTYNLSALVGNITVLNNLIFSGSNFFTLTGGVIDVKGDINSINTNTGCGGDALININGTGTQNFVGNVSAGTGALPQLTINKAAGTLTLSNFPSVSNNFTYVAGPVISGTSTFCFTHGTAGTYAVNGNLSLANIEFIADLSLLTVTVAAATILTATGNLTIAGTGNILIHTGNINVNGNIILTNTGTTGGGTAAINIVGTGNQTMDGTAIVANQSRLPVINVNKPSGNLTLAGNISASANVTYIAGNVIAGTSTCYIVNNLTITGTITVYNITISGPTNVTLTIAPGSVVTASNTLDLENGANSITINSGTLAVQGNLINNNSSIAGGGTGTVLINGSVAQAITSTGVVDQGRLPAVTINKTGGTLTFPSFVTVVGNWTYTAGTLDISTNNSTVVFAGNLTITGSHTLNNISFEGSNNFTFITTVATTLTLTGNMAITGALNVTLNTGTINLNGNLNLTNTFIGGGGTTIIDFVGTTNQAITSSLLINQSALPAVTINKAGGTLSFPSLITVSGNWTYTAGTLDVSTNNSTVVFAGNLTITGSHTLRNISFEGTNNFTFTTAVGTTLAVSGNMSIIGSFRVTLFTGTINLNSNLNLTNTATGGGGTTVIDFVGTANQAINSSLAVNQSTLPAVTINKSSGILSFPAIITVNSNWTYTKGIVDVTTNSATVVFAGSLSIAGTQSLNKVTFEGSNNWTFLITTGTVLTVTGTLTTTGGSNVFIGTPVAGATAIQAQGDIIINNTSTTGGGNGLILINGAGSQAFTGNVAASQGLLPYIKIQKSSGNLTMSGIISVIRDWTWLSGAVVPTTSSVIFGGNSLSITSAGMSFYNATVTSNTITLANNLTVTNNLSITGTGILAAGANTINLVGAWADWGAAGFTEGTSTVNFNGSSLQTITTPSGENFNNIMVNNTGAGIQLENAVAVLNMLTMTKGNIDLNTNALTLGTTALLPGTLSYTSGTMVNTGSFTRWFAKSTIAAGGVAGLFPVGTAIDYRPFSVSVTTAPTTGGTITVSYTDAITRTATSFPDGAAVVHVRRNLNWSVTTATLAGGAYNLGIAGTGYGVIGNISDLRLTLAGGVVGTAGVNVGTIANPQVNRTGLTRANLNNTFYVGSVNSTSSPLPITLTFFTANLQYGEVVLNWSTAQEINNDFFTVQRSKDASRWEEIERVDGAGTSSDVHYYTASDPAPFTGLSYYRLIQTDLDGNQTYSAVRTVNVFTWSRISIYPNPATRQINIIFPVPDKYDLSLVNSNGQLMNSPLTSDGSPVTITVQNMPDDTYFIRIHHGSMYEVFEIIIKK